MPTGGSYGRQLPGNDFSHFGRFGPSESAIAQFLYPFAFRSVVFDLFDFTLDATATITDWFTLGTDSNSTAFAKNAGANGRIQGTAGDGSTDNDAIAILTGADYSGDQECGMEIRWQVDDLTDYSFETGFTDPLSDNTLPAVTDVDTPAIGNGATDVALIHLDTDQDLKTEAFITDGSTASMNTTKTDLGTRQPTAATYLATRIQIITNSPSSFHFDNNFALLESAQHGDVVASQIEGGIALTARFFGRTRATASTVFLLDYLALWQNRA